jgi:hypothetical protein
MLDRLRDLSLSTTFLCLSTGFGLRVATSSGVSACFGLGLRASLSGLILFLTMSRRMVSSYCLWVRMHGTFGSVLRRARESESNDDQDDGSYQDDG